MHSKKSNNVISTVVMGDYLEVYYEDEDKTVIDEIKVDEANIMEISLIKKSWPGSQGKEIDLITPNNVSDMIIRRSDIEHVINEDQYFTSIYEIQYDTPLYGINHTYCCLFIFTSFSVMFWLRPIFAINRLLNRLLKCLDVFW